MVSPMEVNNRSEPCRQDLSTPPRCDDAGRRAQADRTTSSGDLSRDLGKIGLAALGKRGKGFARLAGLQAFAKQCAFPSDLSRDLVDVAHQRLGLVKRPGRTFGQSLGGLPRPGAQ